MYLIIAAVLLSTYCQPIAVSSWFIAVFYLPVIFTIMYRTCIPAVSINAIGVAGMSLGENVTGTPLILCTHSVARALRALVTLAHYVVLMRGTGTVVCTQTTVAGTVTQIASPNIQQVLHAP